MTAVSNSGSIRDGIGVDVFGMIYLNDMSDFNNALNHVSHGHMHRLVTEVRYLALSPFETTSMTLYARPV